MHPSVEVGKMESMQHHLETLDRLDRIRANTPRGTNEKLDEDMINRLISYALRPQETITERIEELENEWDVERTLLVQASATALLGVVLGMFVNRRWFLLTVVNQFFLFHHAVKGWCPPVVLQRGLQARTRREIFTEVLALKILRGDFHDPLPENAPVERAEEALRLALKRG
jgi:hypothetical protein